MSEDPPIEVEVKCPLCGQLHRAVHWGQFEVVPCPSASDTLVFCVDRIVANLGHPETPAQDSDA